MTTTDTTATTIVRPSPICPPWCADLGNSRHAIEAEQPLSSWYHHHRETLNTQYAIVQASTIQPFKSDQVAEDPGVWIEISSDQGLLTPEQALDIAAAVVQAAALVTVETQA